MAGLETYHSRQATLSLRDASNIPTAFFFSPLPESVPSCDTVSSEESILIEIPATETESDSLQGSKSLDTSPIFEARKAAHEVQAPIPRVTTGISDLLSASEVSLNDMSFPRRIGFTVLSICLSYAGFFGLFTLLNPRGQSSSEAQEDPRWIATSHSFADRTACRWTGICGATHWRSRIRLGHKVERLTQNVLHEAHIHHNEWHDRKARPSDWSHDERVLRDIPQYVFDYAPLVHLYSGEEFWPCDIADHLQHVTPKLNYTSIQEHSPNLTDLDLLNKWNSGRFVYLTSDDDPEQVPGWLSGKENVPEKSNTKGKVHNDPTHTLHWENTIIGEIIDSSAKREGWYEAGEGSTQGQVRRDADPSGVADDSPNAASINDAFHGVTIDRNGGSSPISHDMGGRSNAPAVLIVVDKGNGLVDAFWFYFYSFNLGNKVFNIRFGNHVGDWEHSMVRFQNGKPKAVFLSEHNFGAAHSYDAIEKYGKRVSKPSRI